MKAIKFLFSGWFMGILLLLFAVAIGYATFVENDYNAQAARFVVYNAKWFELLLLLMVVNFSGMIFTRKLYLKAKLNILVIHVALIVIIIGAGITRYFGYEGQMHIREGERSSVFYSSETYLITEFNDGTQSAQFEAEILLAPINRELLTSKYTFAGQNFTITARDFRQNAIETLVDDENGQAMLILVASEGRIKRQVLLKEGQTEVIGDVSYAFQDSSQTQSVQIIYSGEQLFFRMPQVPVAGDTVIRAARHFKEMETLNVVRTESASFMVTEFKPKARLVYQDLPKEVPGGAQYLTININNEEVVVPLHQKLSIEIDGITASFSVSYKARVLPFAVQLNDFVLERYPGSNSPSSFKSTISVIDEEKATSFNYDVYMNHILNYRGYRFFQSSYDNDELGTVLTVNHDYWGTLVSYIGYALLFASLIMTFFTRKTRFARISRQLKEVHEKRKAMIKAGAMTLLMLIGMGLQAQNSANYKEHAARFSRLLTQNKEGRIEPSNTLANKVLVKISKKTGYQGMDANEVLLGMIADPNHWKTEKIIKVPEESVQAVLGISGDYASFNDFIDENGSYKLSLLMDEVYQKKPANRNNHDKALINADDRINAFYMVLNQSALQIFPIENSANNKWVSPTKFHELAGHGTRDGDLFEGYLQALSMAKETGNFEAADKYVDAIAEYQQRIGADILPSQTKLNLEVLYNRLNIFKTLFPVFFILGIVLIAIFFLQTFIPKWELNGLRNVFVFLMALTFVVQTAGLAVRWYISGHAPWSNGYESMIYISWSTVLAGFIFMKRSAITLGVTAMLAGIALLTAHMSWLNPELTNLVPVLKSHWLTIHVATITASYGFLGLGCMIGLINLCIMVFRSKTNLDRINLVLTELTLITEMALSVGLVLLIVGNFLGGIWANESWGRYWGWDPKETWTLVTIILYSFTLHLTLIPAIRNTFSFSFMAVISFGAVLMTYFGVNYYLTGLHSYASGESPTVPNAVFYALGILALISVVAWINQIRMGRMLQEGNLNT